MNKLLKVMNDCIKNGNVYDYKVSGREELYEKIQLERIEASFRLEGIELSEEVLDLCRKIIEGKTTADEEIKKIKEKYGK